MRRYLSLEILTLCLRKSKIVAVGWNVILDMDFSKMFKYQGGIGMQLDTDDGNEKLNEEADPSTAKNLIKTQNIHLQQYVV